jgi:hypothetical protein
MAKFDQFTKAFAFANFYHAFKVLFGEEMAAACGNKRCPKETCPSSCRCLHGNAGPCVP